MFSVTSVWMRRESDSITRNGNEANISQVVIPFMNHILQRKSWNFFSFVINMLILTELNTCDISFLFRSLAMGFGCCLMVSCLFCFILSVTLPDLWADWSAEILCYWWFVRCTLTIHPPTMRMLILAVLKREFKANVRKQTALGAGFSLCSHKFSPFHWEIVPD